MNTIHRRIGVLTGGGDCPGLNAVIRAVVKTAVNEYGWEVIGIEDGFEGLILPNKTRTLSINDVRGILPQGGTILGTTNRADPFNYELDKDGIRISMDVSRDVIEQIAELDLDALIVIGGDGSLRIAFEFLQRGIKIIGVPKTIDNDILGTSVTFGFDTAVNTAMEALDKLHTTAESHHRIIILEVMGRDTGWIALKAGIAGGADVILIPEIPYDIQAIIEKIDARSKRNAKFSIIVAAEGAMLVGGDPIYKLRRGMGEMERLGGVGEMLAKQILDRSTYNIRVTVLGHLQRGGSPSAFDRLLASRFGNMAVHLISNGKNGYMVALKDDSITAIPISEAIKTQKFVQLDNDIILTALGLDINLGTYRQVIENMNCPQKPGA